MFHLAEVKIDIIYFTKVILSTFTEILPLLLLVRFLRRKQIKIVFWILFSAILLANIGRTIYFYFTNETIEPIIFSNINSTSINGFFTNTNPLLLVILASALVVLIYITNKISSKHRDYITIPRTKYYRGIICLFISIFMAYHLLYYSEKLSASKLCELYGFERMKKDEIVEKITINSAYSLAQAYVKYRMTGQKADYEKVPYTDEEKALLKKLDLLPSTNAPLIKKQYNKIIVIVFESLSIDFINYYNKKIPKEATPFLNSLLYKYFHLNNFFTSNMPTDFGWTAILKSKIDLNVESDSLFSILQRYGYESFFIM